MDTEEEMEGDSEEEMEGDSSFFDQAEESRTIALHFKIYLQPG
jgi:hypothetical protein